MIAGTVHWVTRRSPAPARPGLRHVRGWALWGLPRGLRAYVGSVPLVAAALGVVLAASTTLDGSDLTVFAALLLGGVASVETTRRMGEPAGVLAKDLLSVWWLPAAVLLPPVYALVLPIPLLALTQWRVRRAPVYRRVFSAAAVGLAHALAGVGLREVSGGFSSLEASHLHPLGWLLTVAAAGAGAAALNTALIAAAVKAADPQTRWRELLADRENLMLDAVELSLAALVAFVIGHSPLLVVMVLPVVLLLQRALLHTQLSAAARTDGKTGLLNAVTWEREAQAELARCRRSGLPAAVLIADLDHFKQVNDTHGHLVGDRVLRAVADALGRELRAQDLIGRFGGEEFVVLLPGADTTEARRVGERLRRCVAALGVPAEDGLPVRVTISVGASIADPPGLTLPDLLAGADACLYRAKDDGRDRVHLLP